MVRGGKRLGLVLAALSLAAPFALLHCGGPIIEATTDESSLTGDDLDGDAGDGGDAADASDARVDDALDGGDADADAEDAARPEEARDAAAPPPKKPARPTTPVQSGDGGDDASTTDLASTFPDPSTVRLGSLPSGGGGCHGASVPSPAGTGGALGLAILVGLVALRRGRS